MTRRLHRRALLGAMAGGAAAATLGVPVNATALPARLDGRLVTDADVLAEAASDFGHIVRRLPQAVLQPGSAGDIARTVQDALRRGVPIAMRGAGHSVFGQAQAGGGIVIDARHLAAIGPFTAGGVVVDAGVRWRDLLDATLARGLTPPVLPENLDHTIGGTLAVGGIGAATFRHGLTADHVSDVTMVTRGGDLRHHQPARWGRGDYLLRATVALVAAPATVRVFTAGYESLVDFLSDQRRIISGGRFDGLRGHVRSGADGRRVFVLEAATYHPAGGHAALPGGFAAQPSRVRVTDLPYADWAGRFTGVADHYRSTGEWDEPHPWLTLLLPAQTTEAFLGELLDAATPMTGGLFGVSALSGAAIRHPVVDKPASDVIFAVALRPMGKFTVGAVDALLQTNQRFYQRARALGGTAYGPGALAHGKENR